MNLIFSGFVEQKNIENYIQFREKYANKCRNNFSFRRAVDEMNSFIADPEKNRSNAVARVIKIKSEDEIQRHLGIKVERKRSSAGQHQTESFTLSDKSKIEMLSIERNKLIAEIVSLKSENQKTCFELNEKKNELIKTENENKEKFREMNEQIIMLTSNLKIAVAEGIQLKKSVIEKQAIDKKVNADLIREKDILTVRIKQLQSGALLNSPSVKEKSEQKIYPAQLFSKNTENPKKIKFKKNIPRVKHKVLFVLKK